MADEKNLESNKQEMTPYEDSERTSARRAYIPRADIYETDEGIVVLANVPGANENSVDIVLEKNVLTIRAYPVEETYAGMSLVYSEYGIGDYERRFTLSDEIDREKIEARVKDGVLTLHLPKAGPAKARKIAVKPA